MMENQNLTSNNNQNNQSTGGIDQPLTNSQPLESPPPTLSFNQNTGIPNQAPSTFSSSPNPAVITNTSEKKPNLKLVFYLILILIMAATAVALAIIIFNTTKNQPILQESLKQEDQSIVLPTPTVVEEEEIDQTTQDLQQQDVSDELNSIEQDLEQTNFTDLDKELENINQELSQ